MDTVAADRTAPSRALVPPDSYVAGILYAGGAHPRAPLTRRLIALAIDLAVVFAISAPALLLGAASALANLEAVNLRYLMPALGFIGLGAVYLLVKDGLPGGASLGKRVTGLQVVLLGSGEPCSWWRSALRTLVWVGVAAVPAGGWAVEPVVTGIAAGGRRLGDHVARTQVVLRRST